MIVVHAVRSTGLVAGDPMIGISARERELPTALPRPVLQLDASSLGSRGTISKRLISAAATTPNHVPRRPPRAASIAEFDAGRIVCAAIASALEACASTWLPRTEMKERKRRRKALLVLRGDGQQVVI